MTYEPEVREVRDLIAKGRKDGLGFVVSDQPALSEQQVFWLMHRLGTRSDTEACAATYAESESPIDLDVVEDWRKDPTFEGVYQQLLTNKREAFRFIGGQMLPKALKTIWKLMSSPSERSNVQGLNLLLRSQGLLIDNVKTQDQSQVEDLFARLREMQPLQVMAPRVTIEGDVRELKGED